jgi:predicted MPP superfamily phosphohydrolase
MKSVVKYFAAGVAIVIALLLLWGMAIEPYIVDTEQYTVEIPGLPGAWEGKQLAFIADLQVGMWLDNTSAIRRIVSRLVQQRPAAVLIGGDFIYYPDDDRGAEALREALDLLRPLSKASIPTYAVLGNHDYGMPEPSSPVNAQWVAVVRSSLERAGIPVLVNEARPLTPPKDSSAPATDTQQALYLVGIGAHWPGKDRPDIALAEVPATATRVVLMHNPSSFAALPPESAPLAMAGHTHGGQVRIPFTPQWSWLSFVEEDAVHADGWIKDYGEAGNQLYVNRGIGFSVVPIRINCPPELTLFTLQAGASPAHALAAAHESGER